MYQFGPDFPKCEQNMLNTSSKIKMKIHIKPKDPPTSKLENESQITKNMQLNSKELKVEIKPSKLNEDPAIQSLT